MQITADLYGTVLLEYLEGSRLQSHLRRGDGRISVLDAGRYFIPFASFAQLDQTLLRQARGETLDLGAGAGRAALYLEEQAVRGSGVVSVVAADRSPGACLCMRRRGVGSVVCAAWQDLARDLNMRMRFDTIVLLGAGVGMAGTTDGLAQLLQAIRAMLRPGGQALVTASPPPHDSPGGPRELSSIRLRVESRGRIGEWFNWLLVPPEELRLSAADCGLSVMLAPLSDASGEYGMILGHDG